MAQIRCSSLAAPFPSETLYSWLSRIGMLSHGGSDGGFLSEFIGYSGEQLTSIFPSYLGTLAQYSGINTRFLLTQHTILPYYRPFIHTEIYSEVTNALLNREKSDAYSKFSLLANRVPEQKLLFYCPQCIVNDLECLGVSFWHREHQLPWVDVCYIHETKLVGSVKPRKVFVLPPQQVNVGKACSSYPSAESILLAQESVRLLNLNRTELDPSRHTDTYIKALAANELATTSGQIKQAAWFDSLDNYWQEALPKEFYSVLFSHQAIRSFPVNLIYQPEAQHHPLKHLLVIIHLFGSFEKFMSSYSSLEDQSIECESPQTSHERVSRDQINKILKKLSEGESLRQAAKSAKVSVGFAKSTALQHGFEIRRREQFLFSFERKQILDWLKEGRKTQDIAKLMHCSTGAVEQILTQFPVVKKLRNKLRFYQKRYKHRQSITVYLTTHTKASRGKIQNDVKASYYWCYKHDKSWLYKTLPDAIPRADRYKGQ